MGIVAVAGDVTTTTAVALAAAWSRANDVIVVEADPAGGDLAAWFDLPVTPSLSTVVTRVLDGSWPEIERHTRLASSGLRVVPAPARAVEAQQAVAESARSLVGSLAALRSPVTIADTGRLAPFASGHPFIGAAAVTVLVHRQSPQSPSAAAVRLQRLADQLESLAAVPGAVVVAIIGATPFGFDEIDTFLGSAGGSIPVVGLPVDELSASVMAGRTGVSERRLARLPLMRAASDLAVVVEQALDQHVDGLWRSGR